MRRWSLKIEMTEIPVPKEPLVFSTLYGSRLYGTDGPSSDTDIRGVFLPDKNDLLLDKAPRHYSFKDHRDISYLSLHYFLQMLTQGETNCLDMFFSYTNEKAKIKSSPLYEELIENKDKLITSNVTKYLGYCKSQALKYSIKGDKIQNLEALNKVLEQYAHPSVITLGQVIAISECAIPGEATLIPFEPFIKNNKQIGKRRRVAGTDFGEHVYLVEMDNKERYFMVSGHLFPLNANLNTTRDSIKKCLASYGRRAFNAAEDNGADYKALSHAVRVCFQAVELLTTGQITFPHPDKHGLELIRNIKFHTTVLSYEEIVELVELQIKRIEEEYLPKTKLPKAPNWDWINEFILRQYK